MSISTKRGDDGETDLMYGRRVSKLEPRIQATGSVDELNAALGIVRVFAKETAPNGITAHVIPGIQAQLIPLMGILSTHPDDRQRYREDGFESPEEADLDRISKETSHLEETLATRFKDWAIPGANGDVVSAHLDLARTLCRRAERDVLHIEPLADEERLIVRLLNRLSDYLWLLARANERGMTPGDLKTAAPPIEPHDPRSQSESPL